MEARSSAQRITCRSRVAIPATVSFGQRFTSSTSADIFQAVSNELQPFEYRRGCLVGNFASEITDATPALKTRVAEHLDDATSRMSVVIEQGQKAGEIRADIPPMDLARFLLNSLYGAILRSKTETTDRPVLPTRSEAITDNASRILQEAFDRSS